jgi:D-arabinose 1-dehydrogenase-like Zn-dependent alcohol dehydrogenase
MIEALDFSARGLVKVQLTTTSLDDINRVYSDMEQGTLIGRTVIML